MVSSAVVPERSAPEVRGRVDEVRLALVARHYERNGDHAVTIAEQVHYVATGEHTHDRRFRR